MSDPTTEQRLAGVESAVSNTARTLDEMKTSMSRMADALVTLARLEERHSETRADLERAQTVQDDHEKRIRAVEVSLPPLIETRGYVVKALIGLSGLVGTAVVGLVLIK